MQFDFTYNNRNYSFKYRYNKKADFSEFYIATSRKVNRDIGAGTGRKFRYDDIEFSCTWLEEDPFGGKGRSLGLHETTAIIKEDLDN